MKQQLKCCYFYVPLACTPPLIASELRRPVHTNPDTLSTFVFVGLVKDTSSHLNYETHCQAVGLSASGFLKKLQMAANEEQEPLLMHILKEI